MLNRHHHFVLNALMKTFQQAGQIQSYKRRLNMNKAGANINGKIWFFVKDSVELEVIRDSDQQITLKLILEDNQSIIITLVYAKCNDLDRIDLWNDMYFTASNMSLPW